MSDRRDTGDLGHLDDLLASEAVWAELPAGHREAVVDGIGDHRHEPRVDHRVRRWRRVAVAASGVALVAVVVAAGQALRGPGDRDFDSVHELTATTLAPNATAQIEVTVTGVGTRLVLDVADLAPAGADEVYEGWLLDGTRAVSAGTFHLRAGDAAIELWAGVGPDPFDEFVVTRHPVGSRPPAAGIDRSRVVLEGTIAP